MSFVPAPQRLAIAQVTPFAWEAANEVNDYVARVSDELAARGHRVLIVAPSESASLVRDSRRTLRSNPEQLLEGADGAPAVLGVGEVLPFAPARRRAASLPVDVARTIEEALTALPLDVVNVHEPFAPSASSAALRHSRALNVGSFHAPTERILSTQLTGPLSRLLFSRIDARIASYAATRNLLQSYFPGDYTVIAPGADVAPQRPPAEVPEIVMVATEERAALRFFLRALRTLPPEPRWHATVWYPRPTAPPATLTRLLRERITFVEAAESDEAELLRTADIAVFASEGDRATPGTLVRALGAGAVPVASRLPPYEEALGDGEIGFMFEPGETATLAAHLQRLVAEPELRERAGREAERRRRSLGWDRVAGELETIYLDLAGRRRTDSVNGPVRARLASRPLIDVDLHMHTDHSYDCATPVEVLLAEARARGLGAIAVTDHNEISGALEARERADGIKVIVSEEVKTADEGEVIGLFIEEKIPRGMTMKETIDAIHSQGGLAYVPHPFDRLHSVPDYEHLLRLVGDIDVLEVFNARVAVRGFNEEAQRFADKYRVVAGAGSDSHVAQGLGTVKIRMRDFNGAEEFLESLRDADILHKRKSLIYLQSLKFIQTQVGRSSSRRRSGRRKDARPAARK